MTLPLAKVLEWPWLSSIFWGAVATLPLLLGVQLLDRAKFQWCVDFNLQIEKLVVPIFKGLSWPEMLWISILAGFGEEMFFRWFLQGGLASSLPGAWGWLVALAIASVAFGFCHALNKVYVILTVVGGLYLGWLMVVSGTVLVPIFTHLFYDFAALLILTRKSQE